MGTNLVHTNNYSFFLLSYRILYIFFFSYSQRDDNYSGAANRNCWAAVPLETHCQAYDSINFTLQWYATNNYVIVRNIYTSSSMIYNWFFYIFNNKYMFHAAGQCKIRWFYVWQRGAAVQTSRSWSHFLCVLRAWSDLSQVFTKYCF